MSKRPTVQSEPEGHVQLTHFREKCEKRKRERGERMNGWSR